MKRSIKEIYLYYKETHTIFKRDFQNYKKLTLKLFIHDILQYLTSWKIASKLGLLKTTIIMKDNRRFSTSNLKIIREMWEDMPYFPNKDFIPKEDETIVDVGALDGEFSIFCTTKGAKCLAFEANPKAFLSLSRNAKSIGNIKPYLAAVSNKEGVETLFENELGHSRIGSTSRGRREGKKYLVPAQTLDNLLPKDIKISLLKIDVEGAELLVLEGSKNILKNTKKVAIEIHDNLLEKCRDLLEKEGFNCFAQTKDQHFYFLFGYKD